jgi:hypothetical protein
MKSLVVFIFISVLFSSCVTGFHKERIAEIDAALEAGEITKAEAIALKNQADNNLVSLFARGKR